MKIRCGDNSCRALTLVEVLVVIASLLLAVLLLLPMLANRPHHQSPRIYCVNNLKQVGLSFSIWANDHGNKFPMELSETSGGTMEFTTGLNAFRHFEVMSNELSVPKTVFCPAESDSWRKCASSFGSAVSNRLGFASNTNLSYFVGVDANATNAAMILAGDYNITNGVSIVNGILNVTTNCLAGWTDKVHGNCGNIVLADGMVQLVGNRGEMGLERIVESTGFATNRLQMP